MGSINRRSAGDTGSVVKKDLRQDKHISIDKTKREQIIRENSKVDYNRRKEPDSEEIGSRLSSNNEILRDEDAVGSASEKLSKKQRKRHQAPDSTIQPRKRRKVHKTTPSIDQNNTGLTTSVISLSKTTSPSIPQNQDKFAQGQNDLEQMQDVPNKCLGDSESQNKLINPTCLLSKRHSSVDSGLSPIIRSPNSVSALAADEDIIVQEKGKDKVNSETENETSTFRTAQESEHMYESPTLSNLPKFRSFKEKAKSLDPKNKIDRVERNEIEKSPLKQKSLKASLKETVTSNCGRLSKEDIKIISNIVTTFREQKNITQYELNEIIQKDANKYQDSRELWKYISENVPMIPKQKLINICRRKFHNFEARGSWTASQDEELSALHEICPGKWSKIGEILNRFPYDCRDRWRNYLVCGGKMRKDTWDLEEEKLLRQAVNKFLSNYREDHGSTDADDNLLIDWQTISKMMGHSRSRLQCSMKWRIIKDRYESDEDHSDEADPLPRTPWRLEGAVQKVQSLSVEEKLRLLYTIRECDVKRESKIPWKQLQKQNTGALSSKLELRLVFNDLKQTVPNHEEMKLQEIVKYLIDVMEDSPQNKSDHESQTLKERKKQENPVRKHSKGKTSGATISIEQIHVESPQITKITPSKNPRTLEVIRQDNTYSRITATKAENQLQTMAKKRDKSSAITALQFATSSSSPPPSKDISKSLEACKLKSRGRKENILTPKIPLMKAKRTEKSKKPVAALSDKFVVDSGDDT